jgi:hypothetical protein
MESVSHEFLAKLLAGTYILSIGSYAFALKLFQWLSTKVDTLRDNHMAHLEARVKSLEDTRDAQ